MIRGKNEPITLPCASMEILLIKIRQYFTTLEIIRGLTIASLGSAFIYLNHVDISNALVHTVFGLISLYLLLGSNARTWFISGAFIGLTWFWWIVMSLIHYEMLWAVPLELMIIMLIYGFLFGFIAWFSHKLPSLLNTHYSLFTPALKAIGLLVLSYIHPFGFDWFKPELMFIESYLGIEKWQFALILLGLVLSIWRKQFVYLFIIVFAYQPTPTQNTPLADEIKLVTTHTSVQDKWDETQHPEQFNNLFKEIDEAIKENKKLVILPESVFPLFLNRSEELLEKLEEKANDISIVTGGLYWDGRTPRNSTYIFTDNKITVANKVVLVPFGESNPLPDFLSNWVNRVFYDGAVDYVASEHVIDYKIDEKVYRNAICFEATCERLYEGKPENMIVLSNNGWFIPSIEPTLQKLLLQYYSKKYGTTIYHSVNMSESYVVRNGEINP